MGQAGMALVAANVNIVCIEKKQSCNFTLNYTKWQQNWSWYRFVWNDTNFLCYKSTCWPSRPILSQLQCAKKNYVLVTCLLLQLPQILRVSIAWWLSEQNFHEGKRKPIINLKHVKRKSSKFQKLLNNYYEFDTKLTLTLLNQLDNS